MIGTLQATEALKLILGIGEPLIGRLMLYDALKAEWRRLKLRKNPDCPLCGKNPTIVELIDYEKFCGTRKKETTPMSDQAIPEITVEELKKKIDAKEKFFLLDVREPHEYEICRIPGAKLIPLGEIADRVGEINKSGELYVHCRSGGRSGKAVKFLREHGFDKAKNVAGGVLAWAEKVDPKMVTG